MKTAITQLIEKLEDIKKNNCKHIYEVVFFDGVLAVIEAESFLETEKKQITEAYNSGNRAEFYDGSEESGENYYNSTFKN